jgi:hypothetical protein
LEARLKEKPALPVLLQLAARKSALDLIRDLALVSMVVFAAAVTIAFLAGLLVPVNAQNARNALAHLGPLEGAIRGWKSKLWMGTGALATATAFFAWLRFSTAEKQMRDRLAKMYSAQVGRLREQQKRGEWENLVPTERMRS